VTRAERESRFTDAIVDASPALLAYLERRMGESAADLLADTMVIAWKKRARLPRDAEQARMWLFGIARNVLRNAVRGAIREQRMADGLRALTTVTAKHDDPADAVAVRDLIDRLDPELAEVVTLAHWEGFSLAQIAALTGVPASTVRGRYQRARAALRVALETSPS
jgi:RNA polymerase sigma factor (sigma-70 family)